MQPLYRAVDDKRDLVSRWRAVLAGLRPESAQHHVGEHGHQQRHNHADRNHPPCSPRLTDGVDNKSDEEDEDDESESKSHRTKYWRDAGVRKRSPAERPRPDDERRDRSGV